MSLAVINLAGTNDGLLPYSYGVYGPEGTGNTTLYFWMLPYIEQGNLFSQGFATAEVATNAVKTFIAPADSTAHPGTAYLSYASNSQVFPAIALVTSVGAVAAPKPTYYPVSFSDGTSNTIGLMEHYAQSYTVATATSATTPTSHYWYSTQYTYITPVATGTLGTTAGYGVQFGPPTLASAAPNTPLATLPQGFSTSGINVAMSDGSVRVVNSSTSPLTWYDACTIAGGEVLGSDW